MLIVCHDYTELPATTCSNTSGLHVSGTEVLKCAAMTSNVWLRLHILCKPSNMQQDKWLKTTQLRQAIKLMAKRTYVHGYMCYTPRSPIISKWRLYVNMEYEATSSSRLINTTNIDRNQKSPAGKLAICELSV